MINYGGSELATRALEPGVRESAYHSALEVPYPDPYRAGPDDRHPERGAVVERVGLGRGEERHWRRIRLDRQRQGGSHIHRGTKPSVTPPLLWVRSYAPLVVGSRRRR